MSHINRHAARGMTLAEMLVAMIVMGLFGTLAVAVIAPIADAPYRAQAKDSTIQSATEVMYRLERDLRMSDASGVYMCASGSGWVCTVPTTTLAAANTVAIATPLDASDHLQIDKA